MGSADTQIAYPQQFKDEYPAGTNTALRVCYRSLLHRFPQMQKINDSAYVICGFIKEKQILHKFGQATLYRQKRKNGKMCNSQRIENKMNCPKV